MAVRCFTDVTIGFPSGGGRPGTERTSPSTTWVIWTTGELRLDSASFALFFTPAKSARGSLAAKPLGCLLKAEPMAPAHPGEAHSFIATTNDAVHCVMRLGFARPGDEEAFVALAQAAEVAGAKRFFGDSHGRRSSVGRASMAPAEHSGVCDELAMHIRQLHPDKWLALTFGGCELYGPQPGGDPSIEVLLGRGAVALLDPKDVDRVGNFEIVFYDEGSAEPMFRAAIGPRTHLMQQPQDDRTGRLSVASRRLSARPAGAGTAFDFSPNGTDVLALSFDDETVGDSFARDLTVRIKLAALSQKTWRGKQALAGLQGEIQAMQSRGFFATIRRWIAQALFVFALLVAMHAGHLYMAQPEQPIGDTAQSALSDAISMVFSATVLLKDAGATVCQMTARSSISATDLERCTAMMDGMEIRDCVASLVTSAKAPSGIDHLGALSKDYINLGLSGLGSSL